MVTRRHGEHERKACIYMYVMSYVYNIVTFVWGKQHVVAATARYEGVAGRRGVCDGCLDNAKEWLRRVTRVRERWKATKCRIFPGYG